MYTDLNLILSILYINSILTLLSIFYTLLLKHYIILA